MPSITKEPSVVATGLRLHKKLTIVPCTGKQCLEPGWPNGVSRDVLREKLESGQCENIGLVLGPHELVDAECDTPEAEVALQDEWFGGEIPPTPTWKSKRGFHRLFKRTFDPLDSAKMVLDGVEVHGTNCKGQLSILPPSKHPSGITYKWEPGLSIDDVEPAELPPRIIDRLRAGNRKSDVKANENGPIPEGERNDTLFKLACQWAKSLPADALAGALQAYNAAHCATPLPETEVADIAKSAVKTVNGSHGSHGSQKKADTLNKVIESIELWHSPEMIGFATIQVGDHREHWPIRSKQLRQWISKSVYEQSGGIVGSNALLDALAALEGKAVHGSPEHSVGVRLASHEGKIYLDMADAEWRAIEIDADGWHIVENPPVPFRRPKGMLPLPVPVKGGSIELLKPFANVAADDFPLLCGFLVGALNPNGSKAILQLFGEQGSSKSTLARICRELIDPNTAPVRSAPRSERDLMIAANNGWLINLDNLSYISPELSDALCRLSTGGGFATRTLYENEDETIFSAQRPIILNGIEHVGSRSDLLNRSLVLELPRIEDAKRKAESKFWESFQKDRPKILGALLDAVSAGTKRLPRITKDKTTEWPRMADFAQWAVAAEIALGFEKGTFLTAYENNRQHANQVALESSPIVAALYYRLKERKGKLEYTATELLEELEIGQSRDATRHKSWPKAPRVLAGLLHRLAPNLRMAGITIEQRFDGSGDNKRKVWAISGEAKT